MGQVLGLAAVFNPWLLLVVFGMTLIAEFGLSVPLLLESVWLFTGYSFTFSDTGDTYTFLGCVPG